MKVLLRDQEGMVRSAEERYEIDTSLPGRAESDPEAWDWALRRCLTALSPLDGVRAVGVSGQMHGVVAVRADRTGVVAVRRAILWADSRATPFLSGL